MDTVYMFAFRHLEWFFIGISLAVLAEGIIWFFIPKKIVRWLERIPRNRFRLMGSAEIIISLGLLYFILYR